MPVGATLAVAGATAGASAFGSYEQSQAAKKAASASQDATNRSLDLQKQEYDQTRADSMPWHDAGVTALGQLADPTKNFTASPDYQFRLNRGLEAANQGAVVGGGLHSGAALKSLDTFGQGLAGGAYNDWWNHESGLAGLGQTANGQTAAAGQSAANASQMALTGNASNLASSYGYGANAAATAAGGIAGSAAWGINNYPWKAAPTTMPASNGLGSQPAPTDAYSGWY